MTPFPLISDVGSVPTPDPDLDRGRGGGEGDGEVPLFLRAALTAPLRFFMIPDSPGSRLTLPFPP